MAFDRLFKGFEKTIEDAVNDPNKANDLINGTGGGMVGQLTRMTLTDQDKAEINEGIYAAQNAQAAQAQAAQAYAQGATFDAVGRVLAVADTRTLIMGDPQVILSLEVTMPGSAPFQYQLETVVSRVQIPRVGDSVNLMLNPNAPGQFYYAGLKVF